MPNAIAPSSSGVNIISLNQPADGSRKEPLPSLSVGEKLGVLVLDDTRNGKTLLQLKNSTLTAESPISLRGGDKLMAQVEQIYPTLVLRIISNEPSGAPPTASDALKFFRSNPDALKETLLSLKTLLSEAGHDSSTIPVFVKQSLPLLGRIVNRIIITEENISRPLSIKSLVSSLGLNDERMLLKALSEPALLAGRKGEATLKEALFRLSAELQSVQTSPDVDSSGAALISRFRELANQAVTVIESLQIVNVLAQEKDGLFMLQIPLQFPDGIRMQELYIEADREADGNAAGKQHRVLLLLDMDSLGELAADIAINGGILGCTLRCADEKAIDFLQPLLPALRDSLAAVGYDIGILQCVQERSIAALKNDFLQSQSLFTRSSINVSV